MELFQPFNNISPGFQLVLIVVQIWTYFWKAVALWRAPKNGQMYWFVALFVLIPLNDLGIISLVYLSRFAKKRLTVEEVKGWVRQGKKSVKK